MARIKVERKIISPKEVKSILHSFEMKLREEQFPVKHLFLFGSYAKGNQHKDSDIDVAVVVPSYIKSTQKKKLNTLTWLAKQVHIKLEPHVVSTNDLKEKWNSFIHEVKEFGVRV